MFDRSIQSTLELAMTQYAVVTITGPRQSGKTTLVRSCYPNRPYYNLENPNTRLFIENDPRQFLYDIDLKKGVIILEILKYQYNNSKDANIYFYCDSHNNEVDVIVKAHNKLIPIEIKSTSTFHPSLSNYTQRSLYQRHKHQKSSQATHQQVKHSSVYQAQVQP